MAASKTLYDKLVDLHMVRSLSSDGQTILMYVDRTILNEYTSPQAFTGLRQSNRKLFRPEMALAVVDHVNSTRADRHPKTINPDDNIQMSYFAKNCADFNIELFDIFHQQQGIEHVVMPELGLVLPGLVIAAGDSHTTTYGAFGALGFGIGTSDIEHLLATQTLVYRKLKNMRISVNGDLGYGASAKDIIMTVIQKIGASGAQGYCVEFEGSTIRTLSIEGRMTICNMVVECGARGAVIQPDAKTFQYLRNKTRAPQFEEFDKARQHWSQLKSDEDARFDQSFEIDAAEIMPMVTWGTSPDQAVAITGYVPDPEREPNNDRRKDAYRALKYMDLPAGTKITDIPIDFAFIGSCTNSRIEDLRAASKILDGRTIASHVKAIIVPGSSAVRRQAEQEGLDEIFIRAGFEWRQSGCSMCLAMNDDIIAPGLRSASSTNRNFEGRQGEGSRTHLMSPEMVAAAAISGHLCDPRTIEDGYAI